MTSKTYDQAERQRVFDIVCAALIKQGQGSIDLSSDECRYRLGEQDSDEVRCGIGHLIPNNEYKPEVEGRSASVAANSVPTLAAIMAKTGGKFLEDLQTAHDEASRDNGHEVSPEDFLIALNNAARHLAKTYNLDPSVLEGDPNA